IGAGGGAVVGAVAVVIAVTVGGRSTPGAGTASPGGGVAPAVGARAPGGTFTTVSGTARTISSLRGRPAMVWFVASWCPSCQAGTQALASKITAFARMGVRVVELEAYADLGQPGPRTAAFGHRFAGAAYHNPDWTFGVASQALTSAYDRKAFWTSTTCWIRPGVSPTSTPPPGRRCPSCWPAPPGSGERDRAARLAD